MRRLALLLGTLALAAPAYGQRAIVLVRHAEKETDPSRLVGVRDLDVPLTPAGEARAEALAKSLKDLGVAAIYTSPALRARRTADPLAKALELTPAVIGNDTLAKLGDRHPDGVVLIVGHSGGALGVPAMLDAIAGRPLGQEIREADEFDALFLLVPKPGGAWGSSRSRYGISSSR